MAITQGEIYRLVRLCELLAPVAEASSVFPPFCAGRSGKWDSAAPEDAKRRPYTAGVTSRGRQRGRSRATFVNGCAGDAVENSDETGKHPALACHSAGKSVETDDE